MHEKIFINYETSKLVINHADLTNIFFLLIMLLLCTIFLRHHIESNSLLNKCQTEQLRGIGIMLIIFGHLWVHVSQEKASIILGGESVAIFFILSGYGLTVSSYSKAITFKYFVYSRLRKVLLPYWVVTCFLLILDFLILDRKYPIKDIIYTFFGLNLTDITKRIDYVRWYITLLLFYYFIFFIVYSVISQRFRLLFLFSFATLIFILEYYVTKVGWYQIYAFPFGCMLGEYREIVDVVFRTKKKLFIIVLICIILAFIILKISLFSYLKQILPGILLKALFELNSILFCCCLIIIVGKMALKNYSCTLLYFLGTLSYELFLLHGAFLIKYNPIVYQKAALNVTVSFVIWLFFITALSSTVKKFLIFANNRLIFRMFRLS